MKGDMSAWVLEGRVMIVWRRDGARERAHEGWQVTETCSPRLPLVLLM